MSLYSERRNRPVKAVVAAELDRDLFAPPLSDHAEHFFARILVVDHCADTRNLIKQSIQEYLPFHVDMAGDDAEAVKKWEDNRYGLILIDVQMPVTNGYTAIRFIREAEQKRTLKKVPIIALTGTSSDEAGEGSLGIGCDGHLVKPVCQSVLLNSILQFIAFE